MNHPVLDLPRPLVLGSTSRYRRELMQRLYVPFQVAAPDVDETPLPGEAPVDLAQRLALATAKSVAQQFPQAVVIGSDQVADLGGAGCADKWWCFRPLWRWYVWKPALKPTIWLRWR